MIQLKSVQAGLLVTAVLGVFGTAAADTVDFTDTGSFVTTSLTEGIVTVTGSPRNLVVITNSGLGILGGLSSLVLDSEDDPEIMTFDFAVPVTNVVISDYQADDTDANGLALEATLESFDASGTSTGIVVTAIDPSSPINISSILGIASMSSFSITMNMDGIRVRAISFEEVSATQVIIDIKPGSDPNCFNINGNGVIPVAILGSDTLNVLDIDTSALFFAGLEVRMRGKKGPLCHEEDFNGDEFLDLICRFEDDTSMWTPDSSSEATLAGTLLDGTTEFEGSDSICVTQQDETCPDGSLPPCPAP